MLNNLLLIIFHFFTKLFCVENQVCETLYGDKKTRIFIYWTVRVLIFVWKTSTSHVYIHHFFFESVFFLIMATGWCISKERLLQSVVPWLCSTWQTDCDGCNSHPLFPVWWEPICTQVRCLEGIVQYFNLIILLNNSNFWIDIYDHIICTFFSSRKIHSNKCYRYVWNSSNFS